MSTRSTTIPNYSATEQPLSNCRWLVFDAVGTLIDPEPSVAVAYHEVGMRFGATLSVEEVGRRFRTAFRASESDGFPGGPPPGALVSNDAIEVARWRWIVGEVFSEIFDREACYQELWNHFARPTSWRCFEDVGDALRRLRNGGYRLAIASNFDRRLHLICNELPELNPIEHRVVSAEVGYRKPAADFYSSLIASCACDPRDILMIGDNYANDVQGPEAAGMRALHLERRQAPSEASQIRTLSEFVERLMGS